MGSALRRAPSLIHGVRPSSQLLPSWEPARPGLDMVEDASVTPPCRKVSSATLLTTWSWKPLHWLELGGLAGVTPPTGTLGWSLVGVRVPTPPNLSAQGLSPPLLPTAPQPAWGRSPFHQHRAEVQSRPQHVCSPPSPTVPCCLWVNGHIPHPGQIPPRHSTKPSHPRHRPTTNPSQPKDTPTLDPS